MADLDGAAARRQEIIARILAERAATELDPIAAWYTDMDSAVVAAFDSLQDANVEQSGMVFQNMEGKYSYSLPVPGGHNKFSMRARFDPRQMKPAGIYHTHPGEGEASMFSAEDIETALKLKLLSYIKATKNGEVRRFDPKRSKVIRNSVGSVDKQYGKTSLGDLVGAKPNKS